MDNGVNEAVREILKNLRIEVRNSSYIEHHENGVTTRVRLYLGDELVSESEDRTSIYHH